MKSNANLVLITLGEGPDQKILLVHKPPARESDKLRDKPRVGVDKWIMPGGKIDPGETPIQSVQRETFDETGLKIPSYGFRKTGILCGYFSLDATTPKFVVDIYVASTWLYNHDQIRLNPKRPDEHDDIRWFRRSEIPWHQMIESDSQWMPKLLDGFSFNVDVRFDGTEDKLARCELSMNAGF